MSIDQDDDGRTLDADHERQAGAGSRDRLHVRAVRPSLAAPLAAGDDRPAAPDGLREVPIEVLEPTAGHGQAGTEAREVARRDDHLRVTCNHCGARVLTRISGAMWGHNANGGECPGSKTWDHS